MADIEKPHPERVSDENVNNNKYEHAHIEAAPMPNLDQARTTTEHAATDDLDNKNANSQAEAMASLPDDHPLKWSWLRKHSALLQISIHAMMCAFTSAIIIPAFGELSAQFDRPIPTIAYLASIHVIFLGIGPFVWIPFSKIYGRKPVLIISMILSMVSLIGGGYCNTFGTLMVARTFQAIGISSGQVLGSAIVVDIFWQHERGAKLGIWTQLLTIGPAIGPLIGAPVTNASSWRWVFWMCAIINGAELLVYIFFFKETLYVESEDRLKKTTFLHKIIPQRIPGSRLRPKDFWAPFVFIQSPVVVLCAFAYGCSFGFASVGLANIVPTAFGTFYNFGTIQDGLVFISVLVGVVLGEQAAGPVSDLIMKQHVKKCRVTGNPIRLERRLLGAIPGYIIVPAGLIIFGVCLQQRTHWIGPCFGLGIANFGLQIVTTILITYCIDCYSTHPFLVTQFINIVRQLISFTVPFWNPNLNEKVGYDLGFGIEAMIAVFFYLLSILVFIKGPYLRKTFKVRGLDKFS